MKNDENAIDIEDSQDRPTVGGVPLETDSNGNGTEVEKTAPGTIYYIIGTITILFGASIFIYLSVVFADKPQILLTTSMYELTFRDVIIAFGAAMVFIIPGIICIGIGKIINLLDE